MTDRIGRTMVLRLLTSLVSVVLVLAIAEGVAWLLPPLHPMDNPWYQNVSPDRDAENPDLPFRRPPHLNWRGNSRGDLAMFNQDRDPYARPLTFRTDFQGFRNGQDLEQADLVFLGDSFTEAGNVAEAESFVQLTAASLGLSGRNLGVSGYTPPIERLILERFGLPNRPRLVVWQVAEANDLGDAVKYRQWLSHGRPLPTEADMPGRLTRAASWRLRSPLYRLTAPLRPPRTWTRGVEGTVTTSDGIRHPMRYLYIPDPAMQARAHDGFADVMGALADGHQLLQQHDIPLVICLMPTKFRVCAADTTFGQRSIEVLQDRGLDGPDWEVPPAATLAPTLAAFCASNAIPFVDLTIPLRKQSRAGTLVFLPYDTHLAPNGHQVVAAELVPLLRETLIAAYPNHWLAPGN